MHEIENPLARPGIHCQWHELRGLILDEERLISRGAQRVARRHHEAVGCVACRSCLDVVTGQHVLELIACDLSVLTRTVSGAAALLNTHAST